MSGGPIDFAALRREREARRSGAAVLEQLVAPDSVAKQTRMSDTSTAAIRPDILLACSPEANRNNGICLAGARPDQNHTTRKHALKRLESSLKETTDIVRSELRARKVRSSCAAAYSHSCTCTNLCRCSGSLYRCLRSLSRVSVAPCGTSCDLCRCVRGSYMSCRAET